MFNFNKFIIIYFLSNKDLGANIKKIYLFFLIVFLQRKQIWSNFVLHYITKKDKLELALHRSTLNLNLGLKLRFEIISKLIIQKILLFLKSNLVKNYEIFKQKKAAYPPCFASQREWEVRLDTSYILKRGLNFNLTHNNTITNYPNILAIKSRGHMEGRQCPLAIPLRATHYGLSTLPKGVGKVNVVGVSQPDQRKEPNLFLPNIETWKLNKKLKPIFILYGVPKKSQISFCLSNPYKLFSTKTSIKHKPSSLQIATKFLSPKINYIKGWRSHWLRKIRYIEMFYNYSNTLDVSENLLLTILKERTTNLNKKLYQAKNTPLLSQTLSLSNDHLLRKQPLPLIGFLKNTARDRIWEGGSKGLNKIWSPNINNKDTQLLPQDYLVGGQEKFSAVGSGRELLRNQFIQYKFNSSNAKNYYSNNFNIIWKGDNLFPYPFSHTPCSILKAASPNPLGSASNPIRGGRYFFKKQTSSFFFRDQILILLNKFDLENWRRKDNINNEKADKFNRSSNSRENLSAMQIKRPLTSSTTPNSTPISLFSAMGWKGQGVALRGKARGQGLGLKSKGAREEPKEKAISISNITDTNLLCKQSYIPIGLWSHGLKEEKFKSLYMEKKLLEENQISFLNTETFSNPKSTSPNPIGAGLLTNGRERIDFISLENLLKSFFKKMYSLISLPILEYLPDKWNIRLFYYLKKNAKTYYSSSNIINSNLRSILGINFRLPQLNSISKILPHNIINTKTLIPSPLPPLMGLEPLAQQPTSSHRAYGTGLGEEVESKEVVFSLLKKHNTARERLKGGRARALNLKLINDLKKSQCQSRSMQLLSLKNLWSNIINPYFKIRRNNFFITPKPTSFEALPSYINPANLPHLASTPPAKQALLPMGMGRDWKLGRETELSATRIIKTTNYFSATGYSALQGKESLIINNRKIPKFYSSNVNALLIDSNPLNLHLFSKWRGEGGKTEYQKKLNKRINTRFLQDEMTIKEAMLFSNPLLKEILDNQSLIYPYNLTHKNIKYNERLALFFKTKGNKLVYYNEAVKRSNISSTNKKYINLVDVVEDKFGNNSSSSSFAALPTVSGKPASPLFPSHKGLAQIPSHKGVGVSAFKITQVGRLKSKPNPQQSKPLFPYANKIAAAKQGLPSKYSKGGGSLGLKTSIGLGIEAFLAGGKLKLIKPWQSIVPIKLQNLKKDLKKNGVLFKNRTLKNILYKNKNLAKLNLILFLDRVNGFFSRSQTQPLMANIPPKGPNPNPIGCFARGCFARGSNPIRGGRGLALQPSPSPSPFSHSYVPYGMARIWDGTAAKQGEGWKSGLQSNGGVLDKKNTGKIHLISPGVNIIDTKTLLGLGEIYKDVSCPPTPNPMPYPLRDGCKARGCKARGGPTGENIFLLRPIKSYSTNYSKIDKDIDSPFNNKSKGLVSYNKNLFKKLLVFLKLIFNKEIELDLTRIKNPYNDSHILNQILGEVIKYKSSSFYRLTQIIKVNANIKAGLFGKRKGTKWIQEQGQILPPANQLTPLPAKQAYWEWSPSPLTLNPSPFSHPNPIGQGVGVWDRKGRDGPSQVCKARERGPDDKFIISHPKPSYLYTATEEGRLPSKLRKDAHDAYIYNKSLGAPIAFKKEYNIFANDMKNNSLSHSAINSRSIISKPSMTNFYSIPLGQDKHIFSYNILALDKWSNLNKFNKQKKIHNKISLDLKNIILNDILMEKTNHKALGLPTKVGSQAEKKKFNVYNSTEENIILSNSYKEKVSTSLLNIHKPNGIGEQTTLSYFMRAQDQKYNNTLASSLSQARPFLPTPYGTGSGVVLKAPNPFTLMGRERRKELGGGQNIRNNFNSFFYNRKENTSNILSLLPAKLMTDSNKANGYLSYLASLHPSPTPLTVLLCSPPNPNPIGAGCCARRVGVWDGLPSKYCKGVGGGNEVGRLNKKKTQEFFNNKSAISIPLNNYVRGSLGTIFGNALQIDTNNSLISHHKPSYLYTANEEGRLPSKLRKAAHGAFIANSNISGLKIKLGGRLEKTTIIPRKSSQVFLIGNMSRGSTSFINTSRLTYKNKRGAYSITVTSSYLSHKWRSLNS